MFRPLRGTGSDFCDPLGGCHLSRWVGVTCFAFVFFGAFVIKSLPRPANDGTWVGGGFLVGWVSPGMYSRIKKKEKRHRIGSIGGICKSFNLEYFDDYHKVQIRQPKTF